MQRNYREIKHTNVFALFLNGEYKGIFQGKTSMKKYMYNYEDCLLKQNDYKPLEIELKWTFEELEQ